MKIVVPLSISDAHRLDNWIECVKKFGGLESHSILLLPTFSMAAKGYEAAGKLGDTCKDVRVHPLRMDSELGWPKASNWQWWSATEVMETLSAPWFWMELDCLPVRAGWLTEIGSAYSSIGTPFMGCVVKTPWKDDKTGREAESPEGPDDKMMCGCGVYPSNLHARFKQKQQDGILGDFVKGDMSAEVPWDLHLRYVMRDMGMSNTSLIGDYWNTQNYRIENNNLVCDPKATANDDKPTSVHRSGIVNPEAVVVHGCKDESLAKLILGGLDTRTLTPVRPVQPKEAADSSKHQSTDNGEVALLREQLKAQAERFEVLEKLLIKTLSEPVQAKIDHAPHVIQPTTTEPIKKKEAPWEANLNAPFNIPEVPDPIPVAQDWDQTGVVVNYLKKIGKTRKLSDVSADTGLSKEKIKELSKFPDAPFMIEKGGLGWTKLKVLTPA